MGRGLGAIEQKILDFLTGTYDDGGDVGFICEQGKPQRAKCLIERIAMPRSQWHPNMRRIKPLTVAFFRNGLRAIKSLERKGYVTTSRKRVYRPGERGRPDFLTVTAKRSAFGKSAK